MEFSLVFFRNLYTEFNFLSYFHQSLPKFHLEHRIVHNFLSTKDYLRIQVITTNSSSLYGFSCYGLDKQETRLRFLVGAEISVLLSSAETGSGGLSEVVASSQKPDIWDVRLASLSLLLQRLAVGACPRLWPLPRSQIFGT
jgi:hypothetical protein